MWMDRYVLITSREAWFDLRIVLSRNDSGSYHGEVDLPREGNNIIKDYKSIVC